MLNGNIFTTTLVFTIIYITFAHVETKVKQLNRNNMNLIEKQLSIQVEYQIGLIAKKTKKPVNLKSLIDNIGQKYDIIGVNEDHFYSKNLGDKDNREQRIILGKLGYSNPLTTKNGNPVKSFWFIVKN